jgi:hypothetical protein
MTAARKQCRTEIVGNHAFQASSLVGSYLHSGYERGWQGIVVAEPAPRVCLVETFSWLVPGSTQQWLVPLGTMMAEDWCFYDDAEWMAGSYDTEVKGRWDEERRAARDEPDKAPVPLGDILGRVKTGAEFLAPTGYDPDDEPS